jgi:hypothetical protein
MCAVCGWIGWGCSGRLSKRRWRLKRFRTYGSPPAGAAGKPGRPGRLMGRKAAPASRWRLTAAVRHKASQRCPEAIRRRHAAWTTGVPRTRCAQRPRQRGGLRPSSRCASAGSRWQHPGTHHRMWMARNATRCGADAGRPHDRQSGAGAPSVRAGVRILRIPVAMGGRYRGSLSPVVTITSPRVVSAAISI